MFDHVTLAFQAAGGGGGGGGGGGLITKILLGVALLKCPARFSFITIQLSV